jgi:hypothetical protein
MTITTNFIAHGCGRNYLPIQMILLVIKKLPCPETDDFTAHRCGRNYLLTQLILLVIKNVFPGVGHLDDLCRQFYYSQVQKELFIDSIDTISNKKYLNLTLDAPVTIGTNFTAHASVIKKYWRLDASISSTANFTAHMPVRNYLSKHMIIIIIIKIFSFADRTPR